MKKNAVFSKSLSVFLAILMVLTSGIAGLSPIATKVNAAIEIEEDTGNPVFSLKWNVPEAIYLKPGSGDFQMFLMNKLTASGAEAIGDPAAACDVTAVAPMADSMTLTYELEANGKKPDGTAVSAAGLSLNIANSVTGAQSLTNTLTGKKLTGYTDAIAGNEYFIKWTMKFKVTTNGVQNEYTEYAYTSVYVPFLGQAGASLHSAYKGAFAYRAQNWAYTFVTGGHSVSGGNYKSNYLSSTGTPGETNLISPLVSFTGGNKGKQREDVDNGFANGGTIPWSSRYYNTVTVSEQAGGGVYVAEKKHTDLNGWSLENTDNLGQANITVDGDRFTDFRQIPNLKVGMAQYRWDYDHDGENNRLRWVAAIAPGVAASYSDKDLNSANLKNGAVEAVNFSCSDAGDDTSRAIGLFSLGNVGGSTIQNGVYKVLFNYRNVYYDGLGQQRNAVVACVNLNVAKVSKAALRNAVYEAFLKGYAFKNSSDADVVAYVNAILAADKVLSDQFATQAEINAAYETVKSTAANAATKEKIEGYYKEGIAYDYVSLNVPETVYLNVAANNGAYAYQYVADQTMTITASEITVGSEKHTMHAASLSANALKELNGTNKGVIEFYYADVDTSKPVTLSCANGMGATYTALTRGADGKYTAYLTGGSASTYESGYITWYVTYTDKVDGYQKSAVGKTYVYAMPTGVNSTVAAQCFELRRSGTNLNREILNWTIWMTGLNGIGEQGGYTTKDIYTNASYASPPLSVSTVVSKSGDSTDPSDSDTLDGCYVSGENYKGYHGYWWRTDNNTGGTRTFNARWKAQYYFDTARFTNMNQFPNFKVGIDVHENWGGTTPLVGKKTTGDGETGWSLGYFVSGETANNTNILAAVTSSGANDSRAKGRVLNTTPSISLAGITSTKTYVLQSYGRARNNGAEADTTTNLYFDLIPVNKSDLRTSILNAQKKFSEYGVYYNGTSYDSLFYNKENAAFNTFINAYDAAVKAAAKCDGAPGSEATALTAAIAALDTAIGENKADGENHAIKKPGVSKQYNVSYDANGDKILRKLNNAESKAVTFTKNYFAKDDITYDAESYAGYDFVGFIKSVNDFNYAGITGTAVMGGTPDYITSAADYQDQAVDTGSFGATSAVVYPNTIPAVSSGNIVYTDTVDPAICMIGVYQPHHYTVTYKANGGTGADKTDNNVYGAAYNFAANSFTKANYNFTGWNTEADGSGTAYTAGAALALAEMPTENGAALTLYAQWQPDPNAVANYTISILVKNASGEFAQYGETISGSGVNGDVLNYNTAIDGLVFLASESTALPYTLKAGETNAITLKYEYAKYTATFKSADGSATLYTQTNVPVGTTPTFSGTTPAKSGYTDTAHYKFAGWAQTANAAAATGIVPMTSDGDVTYYAVFTTEAHNFTTNVVHEDDGEYTVYTCGCGKIKSEFLKQHEWVLSAHADATCSAKGYDFYKCKEAGCDKTLTTEIDVNPAAHKYTVHAAKAETCTAAGNKQYWTCDYCHKFFSDQSGTEITEASTVIPAKGHDFTAKPAFSWSANYASCTAVYTCKNDATHTETKTCTVTSVTTDPTCTVDGYIDYTAKVTYAAGHTEYSDTKRGAGESKLGHDFGAWAHTDGTENASSTHTRTCKRTGCTASESKACTFNNVVTPATYKEQGYTTHTCTVCAYSYKDTYKDALGCDVTVKYVYAATSAAAADSKTAHGAYGAEYSFASPVIAGYTASKTTVSGTYAKASEEITVTYTANTNTAYTVKHYQQTADGTGYTEADSETLYGTTGANTAAAAKTYTGFTAKTFTQKTIAGDNSTVVSIYYDRSVYTVTWNVGTGASVTGKTASVLYGNDIDFTVAYGTGYDQVKPAVTVTGGTLTGAYKVTNITGNVVVNVPTQKNTYAVTVSGDAGVTVSEGKTVSYLDSYVLTVTVKDNYTKTAPTATVNGVSLPLVKGAGNTYTATVASIAEAKNIVVSSVIDSYKLTVNYTYADNTKAAESVEKTVNYGASYSVASPAIAKFVPVVVVNGTNVVTKKAEGTMGAADVTVNIVYLADNNENGTPDADDSKLTVTFDVGRYGTAVSGQVYTAKVISGTSYAEIAKPAVAAKDGFTFTGWKDAGITTVTGNITVYASYTAKDENGSDITVDNDTYLIRFFNWNGTLLKAAAADAGDTVTAPADPARGGFTFAGWTPVFKAAVTGDADYTATFKTAKTEGGEEEVIGANEYVVSFYTFNGKLIKAQFVEAGKTTTAPEIPDRAGFTKNGWTPAFDAAKAVNADASYTASYKTVLTENGEEEVIEAGKYVIKFFSFDGKLLASFVKSADETFTAPAVPERANTTSKAWAPEVKTTVDGDAVYTATYKTKLDPDGTGETDVPAGSYVVSFYTYDDKLIERKIAAAGETIEAAEAPARGEFTFAGWTPAFAAKVNADASYKATYKTKLDPTDAAETVIPSGSYVVTFRNYNGDLVEAKLVKAGETTTAPATAPTRANCTFKAWSPAFSATAPVTEDTTYTATYTTKDENNADVDVPAGSYVVKFFNYNNDLLKTCVAAAGEKVTAPTAARGGFTFAGWTPSFDADAGVNADASYKATFKTALVPGGSEELIPEGKFVVSFYTYTGRLIEAQFVTAGLTATAPAVPERENCTANGWTPTFDKNAPVTADASYTASYLTRLTEDGEAVPVPAGKFIVRFVDYENKLIKAMFVEKNGAAVAPDMSAQISYFDENGHYGFANWDKDFSDIAADTVVAAQYGSAAHQLTETVIATATCTEQGSKKIACKACAYEKTVVEEALGHKEKVIPAAAPTCTETGLTEGVECERCGKILAAQKNVAAKGHSFGKWTLVKAATATEDGVMERVCSVCGYKDTKTYALSDEYLEIRGSSILPYGESVEIPVYRMPSDTLTDVTWTSDNIYIAAPDDDGKIMILGIGEVTLTATTADGLTVSGTFYVNDAGNTRLVRFMGIDKMSYIVAGYFHIYNVYDFRWAKGADLRFRVNPYSNFPYPSYVVRADGVKIKENADGSYTIPGGDANVVITIEGAVVDNNTGKKLTFWEMLVNFFKKIIAFFSNLFK